MPVPPAPLSPALVKRLLKGSKVTPAEEDQNWSWAGQYIDFLLGLFGVALNTDGTLLDGSVGTNTIQMRAVTLDKLAFLSSFYAEDTGAANAMAIAFAKVGPPAVPGLQAYSKGLVFWVKVLANSSAPTTLKVDALPPVAVKKYLSSGALADLGAGDLIANSVYIFVHDGVQFLCLNPTPGAGTVHGVLTMFAPVTLATINAPSGAWVTEINIAGEIPAGATAVILAADVTMESNNPGGSFFTLKVRPDAGGAQQQLLYCVSGTGSGTGNYQQGSYLFSTTDLGGGNVRHFDYQASLSGGVSTFVCNLYVVGYLS